MTCLIYIESKHLIPKEMIFSMEEAVRLSLFGMNERVHVTIMERYILSDLYNLETLTESYFPSFLEELSHYNHTLYRMIKRGSYSISEGILTLSLEDSLLAHDREGEIVKYFATIYAERFGMNVGIAIKYIEKKTVKRVDPEEEMLRRAYSYDDVVSYNDGDDYSIEEHDDADSDALSAAESAGVSLPPADASSKTAASSTSSAKASSSNVKPAAKKASADASKNKKYYNREQNWGNKKFQRKPTDDPDCVYGHEVEGECVPINQMEDHMEEICIKGKILSVEEKQLKSGKFILSYAITDFVDSICFKVFMKDEEDKNAMLEDVHVGGFYKIKGNCSEDDFAKELTITKIRGIKLIPDFTSSRKDEYPEKRVELHLHTVFSESDAVTDIAKMIKRAKAWGHKAIAITDHGVAQAFPVANPCVTPDEDFKIIYGLEGYFVDDLKTLVLDSDHQNLDSDYVVFDIETTGIGATRCKIIEIGAVRINKEGEVTGRFSEFINPGVPIPYKIQQLTSITDEMVKNAPPVEEILPKFFEFFHVIQ